MGIEEYLRLAKFYLSEGKLSQAIATCQEVLELQSNSEDAYKILGEIYQVQGNFQAAMYAYTKALEIKPEFAEVHAYLGQLYSQKNWLIEAASQYQQGINLGLKWPEVYYNLGDIKYQFGYLDAAIECYEIAIILKPNYIKAYLSLGVIFELQINYQAAVDIYRKIITLKPNSIEAYNNLGGVLADMNRRSEAIEVYQQGLGLNPNSADLYNNIGHVLSRENPARAIAVYGRAIELNPTFIKAHYNLGKVLQVIGEHEWAVKCFEEVIRLKSEEDNVLVYSDCAFSLMAIGKFKAAFVYLKKGIINDKFVDGFCQLWEGKLESAEEIVSDELYLTKVAGWNFIKELKKLDGYSESFQQQYEKISEYLLEYYVHFGNVLMENESYATAETMYEKALQVKAGLPDVYCLLGNCLVKQKRLSSAIISYRIAIQILLSENRVAETISIYFDLGKVLEKQQRWEQAIDCYGKVLSEKAILESRIFSNNFQFYRQLEGLHLSTKDWIDGLDSKNDLPRYIEVKLEKSTAEDIEKITKLSIQDLSSKNQQKNQECLGLNCGKCLWEIYQYFEPKYLAPAVYSLNGRSGFSQDTDFLSKSLGKKSSFLKQPEKGDIPSLTEDSKNSNYSDFSHFQKISQTPNFVTIVPEGRAWMMPKKNYWRLCYAIAIMTPDNYLLADISREYPSPLPGCTNHDPSKHRIFGLEELPSLEKIHGKVAVLSVLSGNVYFHWMVDLLPRIEILRQGINLEEIDWFLVNNYRQPFQQETLKILGIPEEKILASDRYPHIQAEELVVPSYSSYLGWLQPWGLKFLREEFLKGLGNSNSKSNFSERIYIGRANARYRRIMNEAEVVEILSQFGFTYITPESMSLENQIATFANAKIIVAPHGSGLTNIVFCNPGTKIIEIFSPHYLRYYYWQISQLLGLEHYYLMGEAFSCYPIRNIMYESSLVEDIFVNLGSLNLMLKAVGII
ncbi:MAG: tetratricopeptide repeat protein [Cyanobacteriota bacterium]|nr:tetratricopeptide repeat protein [Cyanobacteriota bacterium]